MLFKQSAIHSLTFQHADLSLCKYKHVKTLEEREVIHNGRLLVFQDSMSILPDLPVRQIGGGIGKSFGRACIHTVTTAYTP